jgi:hypothetical protein
VVTPSFNHGKFIEETIRSILLQGYPDLEFFVLDGGSTDDTVEIIRKYSRWIPFWVSEPDGGQSAAINRGLRLGSGSHATWINSDDMLSQNALTKQLSARTLLDNVVYVGDCIHIDEAGKTLSTHRGRVQSLEDLVSIRSVWRSQGSIDQPAVLFPLEMALRVGGLNQGNHFTMDYELWGKLLIAGAEINYTGITFGLFRWHHGQKTQDNLKQTESLLDTAVALVTVANSLSPAAKVKIMADLQSYREEYPKVLWKQSGRLAKTPLPYSVVTRMRNVKNTVEKQVSKLWGSAERSK